MNWLKRLKTFFRPAARRDPQQQQAVDAQTARLALYHFPTCPYCLKVRWHIHRLRLNIELRDAQQAPHRQALRHGGGIEQVPCLRIQQTPEALEWLYESDAIIAYLQQNFGVSS